MRTVVLIQARTVSTRLPGKALLPIAGYPCVVLAALRAANQGPAYGRYLRRSCRRLISRTSDGQWRAGIPRPTA